MNTYRIALLPGDGIGPEVMTEAVNVLNVIGELFGFGLHYKKQWRHFQGSGAIAFFV